jgi:TPR repeat protein
MRWRLALLAAALASPVLAQQPANDGIEDLRPRDMQFDDNLGYQELPISPVPPELQVTDPNAADISTEIFGDNVDAAYGAYQRGYYLTALEFALPRAEKGDRAAQTLIGEIYADGLGVAQDKTKAATWYQAASKNGDPLATFALAVMYQNGDGVEKDRKQAAELFQRAADAGNMMAKYNLGLLYIEGSFVEPNLVKAAQLIGEAAASGIPEAQYDYGSMLMEGAGVAPDPAGAAEQFRLASEGGLAAAQVDYATLLYLGKGVTQDRMAAASWYGRAAEAGNPVAQNRYAKLLAAGEGVERDVETAAMYRALARRQGLTDGQLDGLLSKAPPDVIAKAEERARFWPLSPPTRVAEAKTPANPVTVDVPMAAEAPAAP